MVKILRILYRCCTDFISMEYPIKKTEKINEITVLSSNIKYIYSNADTSNVDDYKSGIILST